MPSKLIQKAISEYVKSADYDAEPSLENFMNILNNNEIYFHKQGDMRDKDGNGEVGLKCWPDDAEITLITLELDENIIVDIDQRQYYK